MKFDMLLEWSRYPNKPNSVERRGYPLYRYINIQQYGAELKDYLAGFKDPEIRKAYYARGPAIETIFAVLRTTMQFSRWTVRGDKKVASEASLLKVSFQARKIHTQMRGRRLITA